MKTKYVDTTRFENLMDRMLRCTKFQMELCDLPYHEDPLGGYCYQVEDEELVEAIVNFPAITSYSAYKQHRF